LISCFFIFFFFHYFFIFFFLLLFFFFEKRSDDLLHRALPLPGAALALHRAARVSDFWSAEEGISSSGASNTLASSW
jgi:hypothetical protein